MKITLLLLCLMGTMSAQNAPKIQVHGHRGARAMFPENTIPAFRYAIEAGVDTLELDVAVTKDNVLVVSHDPHLNPAICTAPAGAPTTIRESTLAELRKWDCGAKPNPAFPKQKAVPGTGVPTLDEVFDLAPLGKFDFNVETKSFANHPELTPIPAEFARMLLDTIRRHHLEARVIVQSFDFRTLYEMKKLDSAMPLSALYDGKETDLASIAGSAGAKIISPHYRLVLPDRVRAAHASGIKVITWTANTPEIWDRL
ncbi:MAG TPA: glycerophosphodiester phosphodiesterase family protein, partial [Anaerolineae bacterium]